ncbi:hypothetical protein Hanom_Chr00s000120g01623291 [Helianthus anomalus]
MLLHSCSLFTLRAGGFGGIYCAAGTETIINRVERQITHHMKILTFLNLFLFFNCVLVGRVMGWALFCRWCLRIGSAGCVGWGTCDADLTCFAGEAWVGYGGIRGRRVVNHFRSSRCYLVFCFLSFLWSLGVLTFTPTRSVQKLKGRHIGVLGFVSVSGSDMYPGVIRKDWLGELFFRWQPYLHLTPMPKTWSCVCGWDRFCWLPTSKDLELFSPMLVTCYMMVWMMPRVLGSLVLLYTWSKNWWRHYKLLISHGMYHDGAALYLRPTLLLKYIKYFFHPAWLECNRTDGCWGIAGWDRLHCLIFSTFDILASVKDQTGTPQIYVSFRLRGYFQNQQIWFKYWWHHTVCSKIETGYGIWLVTSWIKAAGIFNCGTSRGFMWLLWACGLALGLLWLCPGALRWAGILLLMFLLVYAWKIIGFFKCLWKSYCYDQAYRFGHDICILTVRTSCARRGSKYGHYQAGLGTRVAALRIYWCWCYQLNGQHVIWLQDYYTLGLIFVFNYGFRGWCIRGWLLSSCRWVLLPGLWLVTGLSEFSSRAYGYLVHFLTHQICWVEILHMVFWIWLLAHKLGFHMGQGCNLLLVTMVFWTWLLAHKLGLQAHSLLSLQWLLRQHAQANLSAWFVLGSFCLAACKAQMSQLDHRCLPVQSSVKVKRWRHHWNRKSYFCMLKARVRVTAMMEKSNTAMKAHHLMWTRYLWAGSAVKTHAGFKNWNVQTLKVMRKISGLRNRFATQKMKTVMFGPYCNFIRLVNYSVTNLLNTRFLYIPSLGYMVSYFWSPEACFGRRYGGMPL